MIRKTITATILTTIFLILSPHQRDSAAAKDKDAENTNAHSIEIGDRAHDFTLANLNGNKVTLKEQMRSHGVVLWFTNLCGGCQMGMPILEKMYKKYGNKSVKFLAISQLGNDIKSVEKVAKKSKLSFQFLIDPNGEVCKLYSGAYIPNACPIKNIFFISRDGTIKSMTHFPGITEEELESELKKIILSDNRDHRR